MLLTPGTVQLKDKDQFKFTMQPYKEVVLILDASQFCLASSLMGSKHYLTPKLYCSPAVLLMEKKKMN